MRYTVECKWGEWYVLDNGVKIHNANGEDEAKRMAKRLNQADAPSGFKARKLA
jgi:hypothetical protein